MKYLGCVLLLPYNNRHIFILTFLWLYQKFHLIESISIFGTGLFTLSGICSVGFDTDSSICFFISRCSCIYFFLSSADIGLNQSKFRDSLINLIMSSGAIAGVQDIGLMLYGLSELSICVSVFALSAFVISLIASTSTVTLTLLIIFDSVTAFNSYQSFPNIFTIISSSIFCIARVSHILNICSSNLATELFNGFSLAAVTATLSEAFHELLSTFH